MEVSAARRKLIDDAKRAGMTVRESAGRVDINQGKTTRSVGITLWQDGTATRNDVRLDMAAAIRTVKMMRAILGL